MMTSPFKLTLVALCLAAPSPVFAQDPFGDPFGGAAAAAAPAAASGTQPADKADEEEDPLVRSVVNSKPSTPVELLRAVEILMDYGRLDVAKQMFDQLNAMTLTPNQLVDLHNRFRSGLFFRMTREPRLGAAAPTFAKSVLDAAKRAAQDRDRVAALIGQLSDPDPARRYTATVDLREAQAAGINGMLQVLADAGRASEHRAIRDALVSVLTPAAEVRLRNESLPLTDLVVQAATTSDPALQVQVMTVLGRLAAREATPLLLRPALDQERTDPGPRVARQALLNIVGALPTRHEAEIYLERRARRYLDDQRAAAQGVQGSTRLWVWDDANHVGTSREFDLEHAALVKARRTSRELHLLNPDTARYRRLYLATALQTEKTLGGLSSPLPRDDGTAFAQMAARGVQETLEVFEFALANDQIGGAMGAVEVLGDIGDPTLVATADGRPSRLAAMLLHENRRLRFAAAQAILKLDPQSPYPGSSFLAETLAYLASSGSQRRVLVAHPRIDYGQFVVGLLRHLGFAADTAQTGMQTIKLAHASPDYQFILVSDAIDGPAVSELLQQLRRDPRTRSLPIGVMSRQTSARRMEHLVQDDPLTISFPRLHSPESTRIQTRRLLERAGRGRLDSEERLQHAQFALTEIARLAGQPETYGFYDLIRHESAVREALANSFLTDQAATALGLLATPEAQRTLLELVNQRARPIFARQAAGQAFAASVQRRGILLTRGEILAQYDRYNESATADVETQQLLGSILDAIEAPTQSQPDAEPGIATEE